MSRPFCDIGRKNDKRRRENKADNAENYHRKLGNTLCLFASSLFVACRNELADRNGKSACRKHKQHRIDRISGVKDADAFAHYVRKRYFIDHSDYFYRKAGNSQYYRFAKKAFALSGGCIFNFFVHFSK